MSVEASRKKGPLQIGQMPTPEFLDIPNPLPDQTRKPIGIIAFSSHTVLLKPFVWWDNAKGDLTNETSRKEVAMKLAVLMLNTGADIVVGPAISLRKSDSKTEKVQKIYNSGNTIGIYIEPARRLEFGVRMEHGGLISEASLRQINPNMFNEILQRVMFVLPMPVGNSPRK